MMSAPTSTKTRITHALTAAALVLGLAVVAAPTASAGYRDGYTTVYSSSKIGCMTQVGLVSGAHRSKGASTVAENCTYKSALAKYSARIWFDY